MGRPDGRGGEGRGESLNGEMTEKENIRQTKNQSTQHICRYSFMQRPVHASFGWVKPLVEG